MRKASRNIRLWMLRLCVFPALHLRRGAHKRLHTHLALPSDTSKRYVEPKSCVALTVSRLKGPTYSKYIIKKICHIIHEESRAEKVEPN